MSGDPAGDLPGIRARYSAFAEHEARCVSPLYEELARTAAESEKTLRFIATLPPGKQQPNLVLAAVRFLFGTPSDGPHFTRLVARAPEQIRQVVLRRSTQTNEPARCATLLPALGLLPQPLALLEVGASAGLCLLPDRYGYDYGSARLDPSSSGVDGPPVFRCRANRHTPIPDHLPEIVWRAGLDRDPVDVFDADHIAWLEALVWPGQDDRLERLRAALRIARQARVRVERGDLVTDVPALAASAPRHATLVIFHSATLVYVAPGDRVRFAEIIRGLDAVWIGNESPAVMPWVAERLDDAVPAGRFLLSIDGEPVASTGPHGQSISWLAGEAVRTRATVNGGQP